MNARPTPSTPPVGGFLSQPWERNTTRLANPRLRSPVAVISAHGDIDASNADTLTEYTLGHVMGCRGLILDLRGSDFFGTEGFSALHRVSVCCAHADIGWAVVPSEAVSQMLRIGDPQGLLPAASTVEAAMATIQDQSRQPPRPSSDITPTASCCLDGEPGWPTHGAFPHASAGCPARPLGLAAEWSA
jgi:anti-anti-sigma regulatory factor